MGQFNFDALNGSAELFVTDFCIGVLFRVIWPRHKGRFQKKNLIRQINNKNEEHNNKNNINHMETNGRYLHLSRKNQKVCVC